MEKFLCSHCGHHFQSESRENLVCPSCFWSTSVEKEENVASRVQAEEPVSTFSRSQPRVFLWTVGVLFALVLVGISLFVIRHVQKQNEILQKIKSKNARAIASQAPELALLPQEREILTRKVALEPAGEITPSEKEILARRAALRSRMMLGLPTPPWSESQFEEFLKSEEAHYRVPLERSYRRKLKRIFKEHYLPAAQAFEAKDFLKSRDEWIRSLGFPVYHEDIQKHRGVVLTMLRAYVNDVLSKIGMMNALLTEKDLFAAEEKTLSAYGNFYELLQKGAWEEANAALLGLQKTLQEVENLQRPVQAPALPQEVVLVDPDIREVLLSQTSARDQGIRDWADLRQDLQAKEKVIQSRLPATLEALQKEYEEILSLIENQNWQEAKGRLEKIDFPEALREDARAKIGVLNKLLEKDGQGSFSPSLDSQEKTS